MLDLSFTKIFILAVIAMVIFGPDQLPKLAAQAGRMVRELRRIADGARDDLREGLGPEFADFDIADLNPRHLVQKHLLNGLDGFGAEAVHTPAEPVHTPADAVPSPSAGDTAATTLRDGWEAPPYDTEAT